MWYFEPVWQFREKAMDGQPAAGGQPKPAPKPKQPKQPKPALKPVPQGGVAGGEPLRPHDGPMPPQNTSPARRRQPSQVEAMVAAVKKPSAAGDHMPAGVLADMLEENPQHLHDDETLHHLRRATYESAPVSVHHHRDTGKVWARLTPQKGLPEDMVHMSHGPGGAIAVSEFRHEGFPTEYHLHDVERPMRINDHLNVFPVDDDTHGQDVWDANHEHAIGDSPTRHSGRRRRVNHTTDRDAALRAAHRLAMRSPQSPPAQQPPPAA